jgi:formate dehydrogenase major subunit
MMSRVLSAIDIVLFVRIEINLWGLFMEVSRRNFLKVSLASVLAGGVGVAAEPGNAHADPSKILYTKQTTTICPYCGVGCGIVVYSRDGKVVNVEGDPDHPINQGSLCPKGQSLAQIAGSPNRLKTVLYRAPGTSKWEQKSWDWAIHQIADRVKTTRDRTFKMKNADGLVVNRTEAIASLGGAALDNEECYVVDKLMRALGIVYLEQQARL